MKSKLYIKHRASKYIHKTHMIKGSGNTKGKTVVGTESALAEINQNRAKLGKPPLKVHHIESSTGQWIFCELRHPVQ